MNILFVCTGNTCRSPMAEGYLKSKNLKDINVWSRGLAADGSPVSEAAAEVMKEIGIDISAHISKPLSINDIESADKIICLSPSHKAFLENIVKNPEKLVLLGNGITDPYGGSLECYRLSLKNIISAIDAIFPSEEAFVIKKADKEHLPQIAELEKVCFSEPWSYNSLLDSFEHGTHFFVCLYSDKVLGYIGINTVLDEGYITNVAVFPEWRRKGIASLILKHLFSFAKEKNLSFISLEVRVSNQSAIKLYQNNGFEPQGVRRNFYRNPTEDANIMTKRFEKNEDISY